MKNLSPIILALALAFAPSASYALLGDMSMEGRQAINITINNDYTANGTWTLPISTNLFRETRVEIPVFRSYGSAASTKYTLNSVTKSDKTPVPIEGIDRELSAFRPDSRDRFYHSYDVNYTLTPLFTGSTVIYEFWMMDGQLRQNPHMELTFPSNWKIISSWPNEINVKENKATLDYPVKYPDVRPVIFATDALPPRASITSAVVESGPAINSQ